MSNPAPLISICTMVRNGAKTIRRCLDSVMALDYPNIEHVIQDGASTDGTLEILEEYAKKYPGVIKLVSEPDKGAEDGFFRGFKRCRGKWIGSCLADETLVPQAAKWAVQAFRQHPSAGAVYGDLYVTDANGKIQSEFNPPYPFSVEKYLLHEVNPPFASTFFRSDALEHIHFRTHSWAFGMGEFELWVRLGLEFPVYYTPGIVATYAVHSGQLSSSKKILLRMVETRTEFLKHLFERGDIKKRFGSILPQVIGGLHLFFAELLRDSGSYAEAADLLMKAMPYRPREGQLKRLLGGFYNQGSVLAAQQCYREAIICWGPLAKFGIEIPQLADIKRELEQSESSQVKAQAAEVTNGLCDTAGSSRVSILVICHNYAKHLPAAVASITAQIYKNYEIIIVDSGSTDGSLVVANRLADELRSIVEIRVYHLENVGPSAARNFGATQARGQYLLPLDADDKIAPEYLLKTVPILDANASLGFVYTDSIYFGDMQQRMFQPDYDFKRLCTGNYISYCSLIRRSAFDAVGGYDRKNWCYYEDWELWIRLGANGHHGRHVREPLFLYNHHFGSSLMGYASRIDAICKAYVISQNPKFYAPEILTNASRILSEMPPGWHERPPLKDTRRIKELLAEHPGHQHLQFFLATAQYRDGLVAEAVATLMELLAAFPGDEQARQALAQFSADLAKAPHSIPPILPNAQLCEPVTNQHAEGSSLATLKARAQKLFTQEKWSEAAEICAELMFKTPDDQDILFIFAHALANLGAIEDALTVAKRLVALQPEKEEFTNLVGILEGAMAGGAADSASGENPGGVKQGPAAASEEANSMEALNGRRVLIYTDDPGQGGAAHYNHSLLLALVEAGAKALCAQPQGDSPLAIEQAKAGVGHCWTAYNPVVEFGRSFVDEEDARRVFDQTQPELVYFSDCCAFSHIAAKKVAISRGIPFAVICHSEATYLADRFPQYLPMVKEQLARASAVVGVSESSLGVLKRFFGLAADKGQVIYSGCAESYFAPAEQAVRDKLRAELCIPENGVLCFTAARLDSGKCHQLQLEAIRRLRDGGRLGSLHFAWAGDGDLRSQLEQSVKTLKLEDRVHILGYRWDVKDLMGAADVFVLTTLYEALPLCIMEAMARRLPVVASSVGGIPEELGDAGILLPDPNVDIQKTILSLTEALVGLDASAQRREGLGAAGKARAEALFQRSRMIQATLEVIRHTLKDNPAAFDSGEIFGPDEVQSFEQLATAYSNNPADTGVSGQLRELQQGVMNFLVTAEFEKLEGHFKGSLGRVFRALVKSGLPSEAPTDESEAQLAILDEALAGPEAADGSFDYRPLFARMLCGPAHRGALTVAPGRIPAWFLNDYLAYMLHAPQVFVVDGEAEQYQNYLLGLVRSICQRISEAPKEKLTLDVASFFALKANYIPLYFANSNTRELAEKRAEIMEFVLVKNGAVIDYTPPKRSKNQKKIKVGYLSAHFGAQTETHVTLPTLQLDRAKFEICLFAVEANPGPVEDRCRGFADMFTRLPKQTQEQVATIRNAKLDVLIIGTNVTAVTNQVSLLALHRLAPVQLVSYCSPVSTGMRHVDGYLTGSHMEFPGIQEHFSEKLMVCDGPPGCLDYTVENKASGARFTREGLGLAADDVVFINAAACFKILPAMQETWAKILKAVPKARLLLLPFNPNWSNAFPVKQFERTLTEACARQGLGREAFVLVNSLPSRADVKELEKLADVYVDTFPFSGSISVIDPLELGIPSVVWEGKTPRSRMASALLRELGVTELITQDEESYIRLSIKLATEPAYRRQIGERIAAAMSRKPRFTDANAYAQGLGKVIESLVVASPVPASAAAV